MNQIIELFKEKSIRVITLICTLFILLFVLAGFGYSCVASTGDCDDKYSTAEILFFETMPGWLFTLYLILCFAHCWNWRWKLAAGIAMYVVYFAAYWVSLVSAGMLTFLAGGFGAVYINELLPDENRVQNTPLFILGAIAGGLGFAATLTLSEGYFTKQQGFAIIYVTIPWQLVTGLYLILGKKSPLVKAAT